MNNGVFDSSAILALVYNETGKANVRLLLDNCKPFISTVNLCEVLTRLIADGLDDDLAVDLLLGLDIAIIDFDTNLARKAARLRPDTKHLGLSFGDRACLALAIEQNATAITADRIWTELDVCRIELIR